VLARPLLYLSHTTSPFYALFIFQVGSHFWQYCVLNQVLYHLSHTSSQDLSFCLGLVSD
jgi:hypothetical protein